MENQRRYGLIAVVIISILLFMYILVNAQDKLFNFGSGSLGALILFLILYLASDSRITNIYSDEAYTCGMVRQLRSNKPDPIDVTSLFADEVKAGTHLHGCDDPPSYIYAGKQYKLQADGKYSSVVA